MRVDRPAWGVDSGNLLMVLADSLYLKVSYGVFKTNQYVLSRLTIDGQMLYCSCRIDMNGTSLMLTGASSKELIVDINEPDSIEKLETAIKDDTFMARAGRETERKIIATERRDYSLDDLMARMRGVI